MTHEKIIIKDGYIRSENDNDLHFINSKDLMQLYGLNPNQCRFDTRSVNYNWIELGPKEDGNYNLAHEISEQIENRWIPIAIKNLELNFNTSFTSRLKFLFTGKIDIIKE